MEACGLANRSCGRMASTCEYDPANEMHFAKSRVCFRSL